MADNNANVQNMLRELEALKTLNNFLVRKVCDPLARALASFRQNITAMADSGVPVQECDEFREKYYQIDENNFKSLINGITSGDLPMIQRYIEQVKQQLNVLSGYNIGSLNLESPSRQSVSSNLSSRKGGPQDYEKQLDAIGDFMNFLVEQRDYMQMIISEYQSILNSMLEWGVPKQVMEHYYQNFAQNNARKINETTVHIQEADYKQLSTMFSEIYGALTGLGNSYSRSPKSM